MGERPSQEIGRLHRAARVGERRWMFIILAGGLLALLAPLPYSGDLRSPSSGYLVLTVSATFLLYLAIFIVGRRGAEPGRRMVLVVALLLRLAMLPMTPSLSDDAYRYLWDGRLLLHGINPYHHVPADTALTRFHDDLFLLQGYPATPTIYPPGAQVVFAASMAVAEAFGGSYRLGFLVLKLLMIAGEVMALWILLLLLESLGRPRREALLYAWHPLVVVELAGQGHTDVFWVLALGLALLGYHRQRMGGGVPGLALGGILRLFPLAFIPLWGRFLGMRWWLRGLLLSLPILLLFLPLLAPQVLERYTTLLAHFTNYYEFNGGFYYGVKAIIDELRLRPSNVIAGGIGTGVQLVLFLLIWYAPPRDRSLPVLAWRALLLVTVQIVLGAKVHVWYFTAPLYLLPLVSCRALRRAWLWALLIAPFTYLAYAAAPPRESMTIVALEWGGFALLAAWDGLRSRRGKPVQPG